VAQHTPITIGRHGFLGAAGVLASLPLLGSAASAKASADAATPTKPLAKGRRMLGKLEVSAIGIGVQNMARTYQTTIPTRTEMHAIIRTAFD
jgi:hypothetical protein